MYECNIAKLFIKYFSYIIKIFLSKYSKYTRWKYWREYPSETSPLPFIMIFSSRENTSEIFLSSF